MSPEILGERMVLPGRAFDFVELTVRSPDGVERERQIVRHRGAAAVLPILETPEGPRILFVRNYRHSIGEWMDELPAGGIDRDEAPEAAAARELREETGYAASSLTHLASFYTTPGMTDELMHAYVATGLTHVGQELDDGECLSVHGWTLDQALAAAGDGRIRDAKTLLMLHLARARGLV